MDWIIVLLYATYGVVGVITYFIIVKNYAGIEDVNTSMGGCVSFFIVVFWPLCLMFYIIDCFNPKSNESEGKILQEKQNNPDIKLPTAEKTTPVPFAQFSLNPEFQCPVCKEVSKTDDHHQVIFCSYCRTPHHVNCYKSIGHCSTYGCHGQRDPVTYQMPCKCRHGVRIC